MSSYSETVRYLYGLQYRGMKFGLRNIRMLLKAAGNPERSFPSVHIAGTNGKGSTASFLASIFTEAGYRTGLYTSPHLVRFTERIRIDGGEIDERRLVGYVSQMRPAIESVRATFFEATTCIAFRYFADEQIDIGIIETGLGGRLDATNTLRPMASVITNIGFDHMEYLGTTIRSIAREKGGIIKPGTPVLTSSDDPVVLETLRRIAARRHARCYRARTIVAMKPAAGSSDGPVNLAAKGFAIRNVLPGLPGTHQQLNARLAVATVAVLLRKASFRRRFRRVGPASIRRGLREVRKNSGIRGRLELFPGRQCCILDVAHNAAGMETLVSALSREPDDGYIVVFGVLKDKDHRSMLRILSRIAKVTIAVSPDTPRALGVAALLRSGTKLGLRIRRGGTVRGGLAVAIRLAGARGKLLVTGSHYVVGEALEYLQKKKT